MSALLFDPALFLMTPLLFDLHVNELDELGGWDSGARHVQPPPFFFFFFSTQIRWIQLARLISQRPLWSKRVK